LKCVTSCDGIVADSAFARNADRRSAGTRDFWRNVQQYSQPEIRKLIAVNVGDALHGTIVFQDSSGNPALSAPSNRRCYGSFCTATADGFP
jgi:hypothetical protein